MWQLLFWVSVALIAYTYFGYPAILLVLGRLRRRRDAAVDVDAVAPSVCLVISAFNEEAVIRAKIENSLSLRYPSDRLTILVASDGSHDDTVAIAEEYAGSGVVVRHWPHRRGKSTVLNDVLAHLDHDIVVFTDANTAFATDAVEKLARRFADPGIGCVVGNLRYIDGNATGAGRGEGIYWRYEAWVRHLESRIESVLVAAGPIFAARRELVRELFPNVANDFQIPLDVAEQGMGVVYEPEARADEHATAHWEEEFGRKVRIVLRGLTGYTLLRRRLGGFRRWQFWSHKLLRWTVGFFLISAFCSSVALAGDSLFFTLTLAAQVVFYFAALGGWISRGVERPRRELYVPFYFTMVNASGVVAIVKFLMGRRQSVWEKAESTRWRPVSMTREEAQVESDDNHDISATVAKS